MSDASVFHQLVDKWQSETTLEPPLTESEVRTMFKGLGIPVSRDLIELYTLVGGMPYANPDNRIFELWGRKRIEKDNPGKWGYVWIGDWLYGFHLYAIKPVDDRHSAVYLDQKCDGKSVSELLANSLYEFADLLLNDPLSLSIAL